MKIQPYHKRYIPPKVTIKDTYGSMSKKDFSLFGTVEKNNKIPAEKKIRDMLNMCVCTMVSISR
jgi:hypothetical protein